MITDELKTLLVGDAGVQAQVSTRVYASSVLPRGYELPSLLVHKATTKTDYTLSGTTGMVEAEVQLDAYASTEDGCELVIKAARSVLKNFTGLLGGGSDVQATFWVSDMDMPFSADLNKTGLGYRVMARVCLHYLEANS